jgi:cytochrome c-type biogenesis protein CcmH/NrfG
MPSTKVLANLLNRIKLGHHDEVIAKTEILIRQHPKVAGLHEILGIAHATAGSLRRAETCLRRALKLDPGQQSALFNLGGLYFNSGKNGQAVAAFRQFLKRDPNNGAALYHLGEALFHSGMPDQAIEPLRRAAALSGEHTEARFLLGRIARDAGEDDLALTHFQSALEIDPSHYEAAFNIGNIHRDHRRNDEALAVYNSLRSGRPDHLPLLLNVHACQLQSMAIEAATAVNDRVLEIEPGNANGIYNASCLEFLAGRWKKDGERGAAQCSLLSLPYVLRDRWQDIPSVQGYLSPPDDFVAVWKHWLADGNTSPTIGLAWRGNPKNPYERHRCVDVEFLASHLPHGPRYVVLQKDMTDAEYDFLSSYKGLDIRVAELGDFCTTAALCANFDMVVTADTSATHLCGAPGIPTAVLLPFSPDSRWGATGRNSDWYNSVTLYRQTHTGDWAAPLAMIARDIEAWGQASPST